VVTNAQGINNNGLVTGFYTNFLSGTIIDGNLPQQGFFYDTKTSNYILPPNPNVPDFFTVQLLGINDNNIAAGYWQDTAGNQHGLLFNLNTNTYSFLDDPGAAVVNGMQITQITGIRRTRENKSHAGQVSKGFQGRQRRGRCATPAGRMISPDLGGAMVTNHLGKPSRRTSRCSRLFISSLLRRTPLL
jgi:hypothetical protein